MIGAAAVGALLWASVAFYGGIEYGWFAVMVGAGVGSVGALLGSRGLSASILAAVLAVACILGGKLLTLEWSLSEQVRTELPDSDSVRASFDELRQDAIVFAELGAEPSAEQLQQFMETRGFGKDPSLDFAEGVAQELRWLYEQKPSFELWLERQRGNRRTALAEEFSEALWSNLDLYDILFTGLGIAAAFGVISRAGMADMEQWEANRRAEARRTEAREAVAAQRDASDSGNDSDPG